MRYPSEEIQERAEIRKHRQIVSAHRLIETRGAVVQPSLLGRLEHGQVSPHSVIVQALEHGLHFRCEIGSYQRRGHRQFSSARHQQARSEIKYELFFSFTTRILPGQFSSSMMTC